MFNKKKKINGEKKEEPKAILQVTFMEDGGLNLKGNMPPAAAVGLLFSAMCKIERGDLMGPKKEDQQGS